MANTLYAQLADAMQAVTSTKATLGSEQAAYQTAIDALGVKLGAAQHAHDAAVQAAQGLRAQLERELTSALGDADRVR